MEAWEVVIRQKLNPSNLTFLPLFYRLLSGRANKYKPCYLVSFDFLNIVSFSSYDFCLNVMYFAVFRIRPKFIMGDNNLVEEK